MLQPWIAQAMLAQPTDLDLDALTRHDILPDPENTHNYSHPEMFSFGFFVKSDLYWSITHDAGPPGAP